MVSLKFTSSSVPAFRDSPSVIFWPFLAMVVLAPVPLGSIYPWSSTLISSLTGMMLLGWAVQTAFGAPRPAIGLKQAWPFILPFALVAAWIGIQMAPWTPESWHHPLWKAAGDVLGEKLEGRISLEPHESGTGLMRLLTYGGIFWLALQYCRDSRNARRLITALTIAGTLFAVYGLAMEIMGTNLVLWYEKEFYRGNVTSVFHYTNSYATYAALGLICAFALLLEGIANSASSDIGRMERRRNVLTWLSEKGAISLFSVLALAFAMVLSNSRAGLMSGAIGVIALLLMLRFSHLKHVPYLKPLSIIFFVIILASFIVAGGTVWDRIAGVNATEDVRFTIYEATLTAIKDAPWTGFGSGTFRDVFPLYRPDTITNQVLRAHNSYLENALELGIPAAILMCVAIALPAIWCVIGVSRRRRNVIYPLIAVAATLTIGVHALLDFTMQVPAVAVTYFALLGTGCAQSWNS